MYYIVLKKYQKNVIALVVVQIGKTIHLNGRQAKYIADFTYWDYAKDKRVIEDSKGFRTKEYKLKKAVVEAIYPSVQIVEV